MFFEWDLLLIFISVPLNLGLTPKKSARMRISYQELRSAEDELLSIPTMLISTTGEVAFRTSTTTVCFNTILIGGMWVQLLNNS